MDQFWGNDAYRREVAFRRDIAFNDRPLFRNQSLIDKLVDQPILRVDAGSAPARECVKTPARCDNSLVPLCCPT